VQRIVESVLFFQPAVWLVSHWLRRDREECCDAVVVAATGRPQQYAELLYAVASQQSPWQLGAAMARHPVATRIRRILNLPEETMLVPRRVLFGVVTGCAALLLVVATYLPRVQAEEAKPVTAKDAKSAKEGTEKPKFAKEEYRYEGKTFAEWNNAWRTELSPKKRLEAVGALGAFARVGHEREAIETLVDVADEYAASWTLDSTTPIGQVNQAIVDQLLGQYPIGGLSAEAWLPILEQHAQPGKIGLASYCVESMPKVTALAELQRIARDDKSPLQQNARNRLLFEECRRCQEQSEPWPSTSALNLLDLNTASEPQKWLPILELARTYMRSGTMSNGRSIYNVRLLFFPELIELVLSSDPKVQQTARQYLVWFDEASKQQITKELLDELDKEQSDEQILAILKTLPWLGPAVANPTRRLHELTSSDSDELALAALRCLNQPSAAMQIVEQQRPLFDGADAILNEDWFIEFALKRHPLLLTPDRWGVPKMGTVGEKNHLAGFYIPKPESRLSNTRPLQSNGDLVGAMVQVVGWPHYGPKESYPELTAEEREFLKHFGRLCKIRMGQ
jgi:hypothetical protein